MTFKEFGFNADLLSGIESMGYDHATPVQEQVIFPVLKGKDVIASAQTGTGKTAAFLLPLIHKLTTEPHDDNTINALIIVPTRELAIQITQTLEAISYFTPVSSIAVYGGNDGALFTSEKKALSTGADIIVCTPGRMIAHLNMGYVKLKGLKYLVLDEADRMLDMGFNDDIQKIISHLPKERQNLLFSATMPPKIRELARKILKQPEEINIAISKPPDKIRQEAFVVYEPQKVPLLKLILKERDYESVLIFCSKKVEVKRLTRELKKEKFPVEEIHSDLDQTKREEALLQFKNHKIKILIATDILSRGIDIEDINLVINFDVPNDGEDYVHRIGRTARAASEGTAFTFVEEKEIRKFQAIEKLIGKPVPKANVPNELGPTPPYQVFRKKKGKKNFYRKKKAS